jgi:hypothetical protein
MIPGACLLTTLCRNAVRTKRSRRVADDVVPPFVTPPHIDDMNTRFASVSLSTSGLDAPMRPPVHRQNPAARSSTVSLS